MTDSKRRTRSIHDPHRIPKPLDKNPKPPRHQHPSLDTRKYRLKRDQHLNPRSIGRSDVSHPVDQSYDDETEQDSINVRANDEG